MVIELDWRLEPYSYEFEGVTYEETYWSAWAPDGTYVGVEGSEEIMMSGKQSWYWETYLPGKNYGPCGTVHSLEDAKAASVSALEDR